MPPTEIPWPRSSAHGRVPRPCLRAITRSHLHCPPCPPRHCAAVPPPQPPTCCRGHHAATSTVAMRGHLSPRWGHPAILTPVGLAARPPAPGSPGVPELLGAPGPGCCGLAVPSCDCGHGSASPHRRPPSGDLGSAALGLILPQLCPYTGIGHGGVGWAERGAVGWAGSCRGFSEGKGWGLTPKSCSEAGAPHPLLKLRMRGELLPLSQESPWELRLRQAPTPSPKNSSRGLTLAPSLAGSQDTEGPGPWPYVYPCPLTVSWGMVRRGTACQGSPRWGRVPE